MARFGLIPPNIPGHRRRTSLGTAACPTVAHDAVGVDFAAFCRAALGSSSTGAAARAAGAAQGVLTWAIFSCVLVAASLRAVSRHHAEGRCAPV